MSFILPLFMGAVLGFVAHRAGLCTVKAVAELLTTGRAHLLWSFAKSALWVLGLCGGTVASCGIQPLAVDPGRGVRGAFFGLGAGLNGGCAFSTMSRLADGNLNILATVAGWALGIAMGLRLWTLRAAPPVSMTAGPGLAEEGPVLLVLAAWALWEGARLVRRMARGGSLSRVLGAPVYTLSAAAAVIGVSNAILLESTGPWSFTGTILCAMDAGTLANCARPALSWLIFLAALTGMAASAWQRRSFLLRRPTFRAALRHGVAGTMMGLGAALIPGGNDGLILFGIPALSPHALPAFGGILAGILAALLAMRASGRAIPPILCNGDICRSRL
jgi:uncharacterized membrane protein YedE/YeeE